MTRKKSRPTHRENAAAVPSNEGGFYKMFWNSMDTNPGTNGPNSPSQGDAPLTSSPVVIISDSEDSPCGHDENSCENIVVPLPIKEEVRDDTMMSSNQYSSAEASSTLREYHSDMNGDCSSNQICLPSNTLTSPSKNNSLSPSPHADLNSPTKPPLTCEHLAPVHTCMYSTGPGTSSQVPPTEISITADQLMEVPHRAEEGGDRMELAEDTQEGIAAEGGAHSYGISQEPDVPISNLQNTEGISATTDISDKLPICNRETLQETPVATPIEPESQPQYPAVVQGNYEQTPHELPGLSLLRSLLDAPDEDLEDLNLEEALAELPGLIGEHDDPSYQDGQNEGEIDCFESGQESGMPTNTDVSNMAVDLNTTVTKNILSANENMNPDVSLQKQTNEKTVDENDEFPTYNNFLPKKIKLDTVGILRSVKVLKDSVRSLYKEYLKDDVILRTVGTSEHPAKDDKSSEEVEETPSFPPISVYPICCVKMERLPDPFVKKSTVAMSDDTFKTWKRQIIRQRNEEKFRHLKVWRRGRTLLWRECELDGMDRTTYNEQVAYVKKHKLSENSSSDSDSSDDEHAASSHKCDSSEESYSDLENEDSEGELSLPSLSSPTKQNNSDIISSRVTSETPTDIRLLEDEYVVERNNQTSETRIPSALKITIRKTSATRSEDDKETPAEEEENFPVPAHPTNKSRKIATKRTYRRPSDPTPKASLPPKPTAADSKKAKNTPLDEYDQSLLGTRSYEVENFNLLEKWDIPFEEPTLFRSPRAASRLAQLKTKEAFQPIKRHAPPKSSVTTITTTTTDVTTFTVSKAVKDVVEMLCSKTVEAILFPESQSAGAQRASRTDANLVDAEDSTIHVQSSKFLVPNEEASSNLDESSEFSQSESNCTLDASSDFSGSTASLVSEDLPPPKNKSPQKPRRRRPRFGPAWGKKKKVKSKLASDKPVEEKSKEEDEYSVKDNNDSPIHSTEQLVTGKVTQDNVKSNKEVAASPVHSTQVPVVSEGPGQSPYESEDDSAYRLKESINQNDSHVTVVKAMKETQPKDEIRSGETHSEPIKKVEEDVVLPRLTRSKQPTVELDPDLLENFGTRKRRSRAEVADDLKYENGKKSKLEITKKTPKSKAQTLKPGTIILKGTRSTPDEVVSDDLNTQVPEVSSSEGPGDLGLDHESKKNQPDKMEMGESTVRVLRSRSRGPGPCPTKTDIKSKTDDEQVNDRPLQVEESQLANKNQSEEPLVLESPASPPPETVEPEPLINSRITRSKRRSGPAYVAVKTTMDTTLPSVCDIVDSIAGQRLPTPSKLLSALTPVTSSLTTEPTAAFKVQTQNVDHTSIIGGKAISSSSSELGQLPKVVQTDGGGDKSILPPPTAVEVTGQGRTLELSTHSDSSSVASVSKLSESGSSSMVSVPKSTMETSAIISGQSSESSNNLIEADIPCLRTEKIQSGAAVEGALSTAAVEKDMSSGTASGSSSLPLKKPVPENVECGRLEVLDTLTSILAVTSPKKVRYPVSNTSPLQPPPLGSSNLQTTAPMNTSVSQLPESNILTPAANSTSLPGFLNSTQDVNNIQCLPGTFLSSFLNTSLDANLTAYNNEMNASTSLVDDPDGDLVIDEGDVNFDVNFFENLTNADLDKDDNSADFSDDDNNTDLADKIDKIVKDQIHQDPVRVPSLKSKETGSDDGRETVPEETSPSKSVLNRRDSIDDRTGLPTNLIQRLRDPRIRSRLLSQLEEEDATGKTQTALAPLLNTVSATNVTSSMVRVPQAGEIDGSDPRKKADGVVMVSSSSLMNLPVPTVSQVMTQPVTGGPVKTGSSVMPVKPTPLVLPKTPDLASPLAISGTLGQQPLFAQSSPVVHVEDTDKPEEPPDPSKVDFVVPPSDDEEAEEESIKRRPKKAKKQMDVELMYKSPLEDLQSEVRPGYGERAPRRYADNYPRRKSGDDRSRWDDRRSKDDQRFEDRGRSQSRDQRFNDRARSRSRDGRFGDRARSRSRDGRFNDRRRDRSRSRDQRAFYDRSPRDQSRDRRVYDPYTEREDLETNPHNMEMQVPYSQSPWTASPAFHHHQIVMQSPRWQPNYYPEPHVPHPPIFVPEPPKIDFMETRLINLELLPKTTNLEISPIKKVFTYFDKGCNQVMEIPPPTYDPKDEPRPIRMMDPVSEEMVEFVQTPRPTSGLTKEIFRSFPLDLNLDDVVKFHFISPSFIMVQDNEDDPLSSSDDEEEQLKPEQNTLSHQQQDKAHQQKRRVGKHVLEPKRKQLPRRVDSHLWKQGGEHQSKGENEFNYLNQENAPNAMHEDTPLQNLLQNLPLLKQFSIQRFQPPIPPPPPAPEWNDVDLRISRELAMEERSRSKALRSLSRSPESTTYRSRSNSPNVISRKSRSNSPKSTSRRSRSKSPRSTTCRTRSKSPRSTSHRSQSKSPRSTNRRSRSKSPKSTSHRSRSKSPRSTTCRPRSKSPRSTSHRSRSQSPRSTSRRSRSKSPKSTSHRSRSKSPRSTSHKSRRSPTSSRHRSRSCSIPRSDTSISPSRSPSYFRRGSRRRRSRSRSSERSRSSRSRRSRSPRRHSTSISPSRKHRR